MRKILLPLPAAAALLIVASSASAADRGLEDYIARMGEKEPVADVTYHDLGRDGVEEALVRMGGECPPGGCEWRLVAGTADGWIVASRGQARDVFLEVTEGGDAVVNSDGVTWSWNGIGLTPYGDILAGLHPRAGTPEELDLVASTSEFTEKDRMRLTVYEVDPFETGKPWRFMIIGGLYYAVGPDQRNWVAYDPEGRFVLDGVSIEAPAVFADPDGKTLHVLDIGHGAIVEHAIAPGENDE
ncbi:hypothetical protein LAZ40_11480 [Cereibacter sphaeroides]|uniref:hypothetical protein n=1 Tax=Cereibacter sphaeroides TaxID=1063 RepID=UPI001F1BC870|nr:hypothetical protein [Cereibacter sphaeroides]MCE6959639.1 hypothetical protein [Cereibacter sphaeroides]MCE6974500.1 hypothetical protein [Cereibacter sphaeroides]